MTCGLLSRFYQLFGLWRHPFTAEDQLVSKWCNAKYLKICSNEEEKKLIYISHGLRVSKFLAICFYFWVNHYFNIFKMPVKESAGHNLK